VCTDGGKMGVPLVLVGARGAERSGRSMRAKGVWADPVRRWTEERGPPKGITPGDPAGDPLVV